MGVLIPRRFLFISSLPLLARPITRIELERARKEKSDALFCHVTHVLLLQYFMPMSYSDLYQNIIGFYFNFRFDLDERSVEGQDVLRHPVGLQPTIRGPQVGTTKVKKRRLFLVRNIPPFRKATKTFTRKNPAFFALFCLSYFFSLFSLVSLTLSLFLSPMWPPV